MTRTFKFCARAIFSLLEKTHPPGSQNLSSRIFFIILHYKYPKKLYIYKKPDTNRCFAKLRAISNLFSFFLYTLYTMCYLKCKAGELRATSLQYSFENTIITLKIMAISLNFLCKILL